MWKINKPEFWENNAIVEKPIGQLVDYNKPFVLSLYDLICSQVSLRIQCAITRASETDWSVAIANDFTFVYFCSKAPQSSWFTPEDGTQLVNFKLIV